MASINNIEKNIQILAIIRQGNQVELMLRYVEDGELKMLHSEYFNHEITPKDVEKARVNFLNKIQERKTVV